MIRIKLEASDDVEEEEIPFENESDRIQRLLSMQIFNNNFMNSMNNAGSSSDNVSGTLKPSRKKLPQPPPPEKNVVIPKKVVVPKKPKPKPKSTVSVAVGSKSIKTEPVESSLSLTTQLNHSLNIQSLLRKSRIQNGWTTNEQSTIPIGTQQEVPLSLLDQSSSLIPNLNFEETITTNCDTTMEMFSAGSRAGFGRSAKLNVNYKVPKEPKLEVPKKRRKKVPPPTPEPQPKITTTIQANSADAGNSESISDNDSEATSAELRRRKSCEYFKQRRAKYKANETEEQRKERLEKQRLYYSKYKDKRKLRYQNETPEQREKKQREQTKNYYKRVYGMTKEEVEQHRLLQSSDTAAADGNSESNNNNDNDQDSGSFSGIDPSSASTSSSVAAPVVKPPRRRISRRVSTLTLEEKKARNRERSRLWYLQYKSNPTATKPMEDPEVRAEKLRKRSEYQRNRRQQRLANATPEQREMIRVKNLEKVRQHLENETEEQREQRRERVRHYNRTVRRQRCEQQRKTMTPEEREQKRVIRKKYYKYISKRKLKQCLENAMNSSSMMNLTEDNNSTNECSTSSNQQQHNYYNNSNSFSISDFASDLSYDFESDDDNFESDEEEETF